MSANKMLFAVMIAAGAIGAVATPLSSNAATYREVTVRRAPPPPRNEVAPAPRRGYVWSTGYWNWSNNKHHWVKGNWMRERTGYAYRSNQWVERDGRWAFERGRWDRDGDGVPNNRDRKPDNPNRS